MLPETTYRRTHRGKRGGKRNKWHFIPVHVSDLSTRLKTKQKVRVRSLVKINSQMHYEIPPTLKPCYAVVTVSADSSEIPPVSCTGILFAKLQLPCVYITDARSLTKKMDELEVFLRESSVQIAIVTEFWGIINDTRYMPMIQKQKRCRWCYTVFS